MTINLEDLAGRLAALEDKQAIRYLKARYLRACNLKQVEKVRDSLLPAGVRVAYQGSPEFYGSRRVRGDD